MTTTTIDRPAWSDLKPNPEVFIAALAHIEEFPEHHDQGPWRCTSGMCFGGWATQIAGFQWKTKTMRSTDVIVPITAVPQGEQQGIGQPLRQVGPDGLAVVGANEAAMIALGIDQARSETSVGWLFSGENSLEELYEMCAEILQIKTSTLKRKVRKYRAEHTFRNYVKKPKVSTRRIRWRRPPLSG